MKDSAIQSFLDFLSHPFLTINGAAKDANLLLSHSQWVEIWHSMRAFFFFLDLVLAVAFLATFIVSLKYRPHLRPSYGHAKKTLTLRDELMKERWAAIVKKASEGAPDALKISVIDGDKLADDVLKQLGLAGEHMADRLEKLSSQELKSLDRLWRAHRLRNNLVHTPGFQISISEARKAIEDYESFLKEVKVLQ